MQKAAVTQLDIQMGTDRIVYAVWSWYEPQKNTTKNYKVKWYYATGNGVWFLGSEDETTDKKATYSAPSNAKSVAVYVKPISKTYRKNNKETNYWTTDWSTKKTYTFSSNPPGQPSAPSVELKVTENREEATGNKRLLLTSRLDNLDINATHIHFRIVYDNSKVFKNSDTIAIKTKSAAFTYEVAAGKTYKVAARGYNKNNKEFGEWSEYSNLVETPPVAPSQWDDNSPRTLSETSVYLNWNKCPTATKYEVEYTTKKNYFDSNPSEVQSVTVNEGTSLNHAEISGLESGNEYFFRVRAVNDAGSSAWLGPVSLKLGSQPSPPTTWSSTTTVKNTEDLTLYWLHNAEDGSAQTESLMEIYFGNMKNIRHITGNGEYAIDKDGKLTVVTSPISDWSTTLPNVTSEKKYLWNYPLIYYGLEEGPSVYGSIMGIVNPQMIATYDSDNSVGVSSVSHRYGSSSSKTTEPIGYLVDDIPLLTDEKPYLWSYEVVTYTNGATKNTTPRVIGVKNDTFQTIDAIEEYYLITSTTTGVKIYTSDDDKYNTTSCKVDVSPYDEGVKIKWRVKTKGIIDKYSDWSVQRTVDVYDPPTLMFELNDGNMNDVSSTGSFKAYPLTIIGHYSPNTQTPIGYHVSIIANESYETVDNVGNYKWVNTGEEVFSKYYDAKNLNIQLTPGDVTLSNNVNYTIKCRLSMNSGLTADAEDKFDVAFSDDEYSPACEIAIDHNDLSAYICPYCYIPGEESTLASNVTLSVYRREFDGTFKEILTGIENNLSTWVTDPHPALDYARYRIVATSTKTGHIEYADIPGEPIQEKSVVIQWDEEWQNYETTVDEPLAETSWSGSMLKLPYNIDVSDSNNKDIDLVEYIGRSYPVSYYGTHIGQTANWSVEIAQDDAETLYMLRKLSIWMGDVYVREPSGSGYWASIAVSFSQKHRELTIPVTLQITRVMGGV